VAYLRRPPYTKPLPPDADLFTHKGKLFARFKDRKGRTIEAPLNADGRRVRLRSRVWHGYYSDRSGREYDVPLCTNKTAAEQMLAELVRRAEMKRANLADPFETHRNRPLAEHLAEWEAALRAGGASAKHVTQTVAGVRRILNGCRFVFLADLSASRVQTFLAVLRERPGPVVALDPAKDAYTRKELAAVLGVKPSAVTALVRRYRLEAKGNGKARRYPRATAEALLSMRPRGKSIKTSNLYLAAVKQFCGWLVQDRRMADNPLAHLSGGNVKLDRRHDRRPLTADELRRMLAAAEASKRNFRGLTGRDRYFVFLIAASSGFRAGELASLTPEAFALDRDAPTVTLGAAFAKNKRTATQPLPLDVAAALRGYLSEKRAGLPVWPGGWVDNAAEMLQGDLEAAGIPYVIDGPDGPLYADFHSLRHSFIALLDKSGATLKEAMQLARHSDPKLTMAVYGRSGLHDLAAAVERLPPLLSPAPEGLTLRATGTDGANVSRTLAPLLAPTSDFRCEGMRTDDNVSMGRGATGHCHNLFGVKAVKNNCEPMREDEESSPSENLLELQSAHCAREWRERAPESAAWQAVAGSQVTEGR
jgi:integrase